ncbi:unnamed protein product, partial [Rotaria magnacalcarata]
LGDSTVLGCSARKRQAILQIRFQT